MARALVVAVTLVGGCGGSSPAKSTKPAARGEAGPPAAAQDKYERMRLEFAASEGFDAYAIQIQEKVLIDEAMAAWEAGDAATTAKKLQAVLEVYPVSIEAHRRLADMFEILLDKTNNPDSKRKLEEMESYHRQMADGLVKSIIASGDGTSRETAYKVITISEEYMVVFYLGLSAQGQRLLRDDATVCDEIRTVDPNGTERRVYFDISSFFEE